MTDGGSAVLLFLRMAFSLLVVLGLIVVAARYLGRGGASVRGRRNADVDVLARASLSRNASVAVVQVADQVLVLGVTDAAVNTLATLDPAALAVSVEEADEPQDALTPGTPPFGAALKAALPVVLAQAAGRAPRPWPVPAALDTRSGRHRG